METLAIALLPTITSLVVWGWREHNRANAAEARERDAQAMIARYRQAAGELTWVLKPAASRRRARPSASRARAPRRRRP